MEKGNGDPALTEFGEAVTPNQHNLARKFVTLDNFMDTAEVSYDGWLWTTSARAPDVVERQMPVAYAYRGTALDGGGLNRNVNVAIPTLAGRIAANPSTPADPNLLAGGTDVAAPDGPGNEVNTGYLWDAAFRANLTVRNYGFFIDGARYGSAAFPIPLERDPFASRTVVAYASSASLAPFTDPYFRGFDNSFPDYYRYKEWEREFDTNYANGGLPSLSLIRFMHNHTGNYDTAIDGVDIPERQVADYNTIDFVRTIEEVLGLPPLNLNDALAKPMADVFNLTPSPWSFTAAPSALLYATALPLPPRPVGLLVPKSAHNAKYWARVMNGMDFEVEDRVDPLDFNHLLWKGLKGNQPYPAKPTGADLRQNREELLARYRRSLKH